MKQVRKTVIFIVILSLMLSNLVYADPIGTIINTSPGSTTWQEMQSSSGSNTMSQDNYQSDSGGFIAGMGDSFLKWILDETLAPLSATFNFDYISRLIFNYEPMTKLSFFDTSVTDGMPYNLMQAIAPVYVAFRYIAIICYVAIILYLAIRMLLSTVSKQKAMYKELIKVWVSGVLILLTFNWLMTYTIVLSDTLVEVLASAVKYDTNSGVLMNSLGSLDTIIEMCVDGAGIFIALIYLLILLGMTVAVWWTYIKRLFTVALLIMVFPLVTITYVFDKIGDRKSQILGSWTKEFMTNVFVQPIQAMALILIMMAMQTTTVGLFGGLIKLVLLFMLFPAEKLLKRIFDVNPGINGGGFAGAGAGMVSSLMMVSKAAPILRNNVRNFRDARDAKAVYNNLKGQKNVDQGKLAEAEKKAKAASIKRWEAATGTVGTLFGAGLTGDVGKAMMIGAGADKMTGWAAEKSGTMSAKNTINKTYKEFEAGIDNGDLNDTQKKNIANRLGISISELDRTLANAGGRELVKNQLKSERQAALAHLKTGEAGAIYERNKFKDSIKLDSDGNFKKMEDGHEVDAGKLGKLKVSKNNISALDTNGNIRMNLLNSDGKAFKHASFSDDKEVDYDFDISGPAGEVVLCADQKEKAKVNARKKALEGAGLENASEAEQKVYLDSGEGKKQFTRKYESEIEKEVKIVEELREATGMQNLQVTSMTVNAVSAQSMQQQTSGTTYQNGGTIPQPAPVAAAPVNTQELTQAISNAFQASMSSVANNISNSMSSELRTIIDGLKNNLQNATPGSTIKIESDIREQIQGISGEMARNLQIAANDYTKAVTDAQNSAVNFLEKFGASTKSSDASIDLQIKYSEEAAKVIESSREARRKAGLDAI